MIGRLAENVQVRRESWGLLFYSPPRHKVCFIRSGDWLYPDCFDGTWTFDELVGDITRRKGAPEEAVGRSLKKLLAYLKNCSMILP